MATWTSIADATFEPGKPIRAIDARALRDNPIAIAEGAAGAPKIETAGITDLNVTTAKIADLNVTTAKIADLNVTTAKIANGNVTNTKIQAPTTGTGNIITRVWLDEITFGDNTAYLRLAPLSRVLISGEITVYAEIRRQTFGTTNFRVLLNGSQVLIFTTTSNSYVGFTGNVTVNLGDLLNFELQAAGTPTAFVRNIILYSNSPTFAVA